jgi:diguanylate cyclase (GGDEF)-like protein
MSAGARPVLIGIFIVLIGICVSALLAVEWRSSELQANRKSFESTATDLSSTLDSRLDTTTELTRTMRAIATMEPDAGETRYLQWYNQLQRGAPATTGVGIVLIQPVSAAALPAFHRRAEADPAFRRLLGGKFEIVPPGHRPSYCLNKAIVGATSPKTTYPALLDYCSSVLPGIGRSPYPALIRTERDRGSFIVTPVAGSGLGAVVGIGAAVYRPGASLTTVTARRAALTGLIGTSFNSATLIRPLLSGRDSLTMALYHRNSGGPLQLIGRAGAHPQGRSPGYLERRNLGEGWVVEVSGLADRPLRADTQGIVAFCLGLLVTMLIFLLYRVLSRSRQRAWGLVGEKTGELAYRALHDLLTDLPTTGLVLDRAEQILARARRLDVPVTALSMDIDGFKQVNDRFGHQAGDDFLRQVGGRLKTVLRDNDTVGRIGGDEFVMLVDPPGLNAAPELIAERILDVIRHPIQLPGPSSPKISVTASIGIATCLPETAEDLLQNADIALNKAKAGGKDRYVQFESAMHTATREHIDLETDLAGALAGDEFFLAYQPMVELASEHVVGVEALLRWRHPTKGVVAPDVFIPIAEENGMIVSIGRWVLEQACLQGADWQQRGCGLNLSVNVSARQLERADFVNEVRTSLGNSGLDPATLTLEITETVLMREPDTTALLLTELKALGLRVAVDDFGTGYSSLAYLRQFPVDSLKIDRTFITGLETSSEGHALAHTLIQLGKALGLQTLAEGVEQQSQARELQREGCDLAQGFLYSRPLTPAALEDFLHDGRVPANHGTPAHVPPR